MAKKYGHLCWPDTIPTEYPRFEAGLDDFLCGLESHDVFVQRVLFPVGAIFDVCLSMYVCMIYSSKQIWHKS